MFLKLKKKLPKNNWFLPATLFVVVLGLSVSIIVYKNYKSGDSLASQTSVGFTYDCKPDQPNSIECFQKQYADISREQSISESFKFLRQEYPKDSAVQANCHQITHAIGREAIAKYTTIEGAFDHGDNFCWSGYYHGVMEAVAKNGGADEVNNNLTTICQSVANKRKYSFYHYNCVHGLGHGLMAINDDELFEVLELCDRFSDTWEQKSCYGGAYMENIMVALQSGGKSKYLSDDQPMYPCTAVQEKYKSECYLMQTSQALRVTGQDYARVFSLCSQAGDYQSNCFQSLGRDASGNSTSNVEQTISVCNLGSSEFARENCIIGAVKDFISYYGGAGEATKLCNGLQGAIKDACITTKDEYIKTL